MPPSLATYQSEAQSIYDPQLTADIGTATATEQNAVATDEAGKAPIEQDYQTAVDKLTQQVEGSSASIDQLYSQRLGGNFSGLEGNDMGKMFATAATARATIEDTRATKLAAITTDEGNLSNSLNADIASLKSKYQGEEADYASGAYNTATNEYNTQQAEDARQAASEANSNAKASTAAANVFKVAYKQGSSAGSGAKLYTGPNGSTNLYQYAQGVNGGDSADPTAVLNTIQSELSTGSSTDKQAANDITQLTKNGASQSQIVNYLASAYSYIFQ